MNDAMLATGRYLSVYSSSRLRLNGRRLANKVLPVKLPPQPTRIGIVMLKNKGKDRFSPPGEIPPGDSTSCDITAIRRPPSRHCRQGRLVRTAEAHASASHVRRKISGGKGPPQSKPEYEVSVDGDESEAYRRSEEPRKVAP
jgi:hypothetical protein